MSETGAWSRTFQLILFVIIIASVLSKSIFVRTPHLRVKKHVADQRLAELQVLLALAKNLPDVRQSYGHGYADPFEAGRKKRSVEQLNDDVTTDKQQQQPQQQLSHDRDDIRTVDWKLALLDDAVRRRLWVARTRR